MNTPAHLVLNVALVERLGPGGLAGAALLGALVPDLPMFVFFGVEGIWRGESAARLWGELYFAPHWQLFFDVFNSIPLALLGLGAALALRRSFAAALFASVALHALVDLPLHHDDAHRHFLPLSNLRFESPISYWDPRHYGAIGALLECCALTGGAVALWPRSGRVLRVLLAALVALSTLVWVLAYGLGYAPA